MKMNVIRVIKYAGTKNYFVWEFCIKYGDTKFWQWLIIKQWPPRRNQQKNRKKMSQFSRLCDLPRICAMQRKKIGHYDTCLPLILHYREKIDVM